MSDASGEPASPSPATPPFPPTAQAGEPDVDVTVIIISFNTLEMTRECLESTFACTTRSSLQVIVVDNDSKDGSVEMIRRDFPQVEVIANSDNRGFAAANNQAIEVARGRHLLLLNSDTIVLGDAIDASVDYLEANDAVGAMGCRVLNTDRTMQPTCSRYPSLLNLVLLATGLDRLSWPPFAGRYHMRSWARDDERPVDVISGCYLLVRRSVVEQVGVLDDSFFFFGEETDWCRRMRDAGWALMFAPVGEIVHHGGGSVKKLNHKRDVMLTEALVRLHRKHGGVPGGACAYAILFGFNASRAVLWSLGGLLVPRFRARATHFRRVVATGVRWPAQG